MARPSGPPTGPEYPLARDMGNGASVSDWLGTSKTAAEVAARLIERVRDGKTLQSVKTLARAERELEQALRELRAVRDEAEGAP